MPERFVLHLFVRAMLAGVALTLLWGAPSGCATAQSRVMAPERPVRRLAADEARWRATAAYQLAQERYGEGDDVGALRAANDAFRALPNASTAVIRGTILARLARHREAFEAFLLARDLDPNVEELALIRAGLGQHGGQLDPPMGWVRFETGAEDVRVTVAGRSLKLPRTLGLPVGVHRVTIEVPGRLPEVREIAVQPGQGTPISL